MASLSQVDWSKLELRTLAGFRGSSAERFDPADGLDEAEMVAIALTLDPALQARRAQIGEADALLVSAGLWPNPEFGIGLRPGLGTGGVEVDAEMLFELLRKRERTMRAAIAEARIAQVKGEISAEEYAVAGKVRLQRQAVLAAEQSLALLHEEGKMRQRALELAKQRRELGEGTVLDVALAEMESVEIGRDVRRAQQALDAARRELVRLMGLPPDFVLKLDDAPGAGVTVYQDLDEAVIQERILAGRQDLKAREHAYRGAEEELQLAILGQYPRLKIGPSFGHDGEGGDFLGLGVAVEVPLFDRNQGEIAARLAQRERLRGEYRALLFELNAEAAAALAEIGAARADIEAQDRDVLPQLARTQALFEAAFKAKELSITEWLIVQQGALRTRREYLETLSRYRGAVIRLETAIGQQLVPADTATQPVPQQ
jgi:outer membrane protein TolC